MHSQTFFRHARSLLLCLIIFTTARPLPALETFGSWTTATKSCEAIAFIKRMKEEFAARVQRLTQEGGAAVDITMPFLDGMESQDEKVAADWTKFVAGSMGEASTARWIGRGLKEMEGVRKKLAAAEKPAATAWDKKHKDGRKAVELPPEAMAFIYEMQVSARNLGVLLDNSPSMRTVLPLVRAEIIQRFTGARFLEVGASSLKMPSPKWGLYGEWFYATILEERNPFDQKWFLPAIPQEEIHNHMSGWKRDSFAAMRSLVTLMEVDAIYWFCDFEDLIEPAAVSALGDLLKKNKVRLYIHSVKNMPPAALMNLVRETNGKTTRVVPGGGAPAAGVPVTPAPAPSDPVTPAPATAASLITEEFLEANVDKTVCITGTIGSHWVYENYGTVALNLTAVETSLSIRFPDKAFKPTTSRGNLEAAYPKGRVFEATGRLQQSPGKDSPGVKRAIFLTLSALSDFKVLPAGTSLPVAATTADPAAPKQRAVDPFRYREIKSTSFDLNSHVDKPVMITARVKVVDKLPGTQHIRITLEGTNLLLICRDKEYPQVFPVTGIRAGDLVKAHGVIKKLKSDLTLVLEVINVASTDKVKQP